MPYVDVFRKYYAFDKLPQGNKYYPLKKDNYESVMEQYRNGCIELRAFPIRTTLQTTYDCNLECIMCQLRSERRNTSMKKSDFDLIVERLFPHLVEVHPTNIGEPLMSDWFEYFCDKVCEYGVLLDITTNGMVLNEKTIYKILPNLLDIKISFDGIRKETFEKIRKNSNFELICKNIDNLLRIKQKENFQGTVTLQMTLLNFNYMELQDIIRFAHDRGIDRVKAYHVFSYSDEMDECSLVKKLELFENIRVQAINLAKELNICLEISEPDNKNGTQNLIPQKCRLPWCECWIDYDGKIFPCHSHNNINYGNIYSTGFQTIWNSDNAKELRKSLINSDIKCICTNCGMNFIKHDENQPVPYDMSGYLCNSSKKSNVRWSSRSKQFQVQRNIMNKSSIADEIRLLYPNEPVKMLAEGGMSFACESGGYIIRIPKNEYAELGYRIEEKVLTYLRGRIKSVEIPNVKIVESPFFYTIHKKLEGIYWDGNAYNKRSEREKDLLACDCATFFAELHSSNISEVDVKLCEIRPIRQNMEKYLAGEFSQKEIDSITAYTDFLYTLPDKCLIHNDFYHDNFFIDENFRLKCVIDFANCGYYNYHFDLRKVISYEEGERDFFERIVRYYDRITEKKIDFDIIRAIDVHNYISFLVYFAKNPDIKEEKIGVRSNWRKHVEHVKDKIRRYKIV